MTPAPWFNFAVALALGLLIGLERERSKGEGAARRAAGIRTFALASLFGALAVYLGGVALLAVATGGVIALTALAYSRDPDRGLTTEAGLMATPLIGGLAMSDTALAAALGVSVAVVLAAKAPLHRFARRALTAAEVNDGLVFAVASVVIWPQLPDRMMGPYQALNPHSIWFLVVLLLALGAGGHIATRLLGSRFGLPIAGFASGFASSIAAIAAMAARARRDPSARGAAVAGAALSTVATFVQMAIVLASISRPALAALAPALAAGGAIALLYGLAFAVKAVASPGVATARPSRAFSVGTALAIAATMAVMLVGAAALKAWLGDAGVLAGAAAAGFVDTHAAAIAVASLASADRLAAADTVAPILAAMTSNAATKIGIACAAGSPDFAWRIVPGIALSIAAAWAVAAAPWR